MNNIKHKLAVMVAYPGEGDMPRQLVKELCADAKAEIERLEKELDKAKREVLSYKVPTGMS